jgi:hypothetical protein
MTLERARRLFNSFCPKGLAAPRDGHGRCFVERRVPRTSGDPWRDRKMKVRWIATGGLALAGLLAVPPESQAETRVGIVIAHDSRDYRHSGYRHHDTYRLGYERGYQDGIRHGAKDGHRDDSYNFWHDRRYRRGDAGYRGWMGPRHEYVAGYRRGYEQGYRRAFVGTRHRHPGRDGWCYENHGGRYGRYGYDDDRDDERLRKDPYPY